MPIWEQYVSGFAWTNADGSLSHGAIFYEWDGSLFRKRVVTGLHLPPENVNFGVETVARHANDGVIAPYLHRDDPSISWMRPGLVAMLRLAVVRDMTTLERALHTFGDTILNGADWWGFGGPEVLPDTLTPDQEASVLRQHLAYDDIRVRDVLIRPNAWVDSSATDHAHLPWAAGSSPERVETIANAWIDYEIPELSSAARSLLQHNELLLPGSPPADSATDLPFELSSTPHRDLIAKAYLAYFLRPADGQGFNYYAEVLRQNGGDWAAMTSGFGHSPEYLETYGGLDPAQRINAIYENLFGRSAETDGLSYWATRLKDGTFTISDIALSVLLGAQNDDALVIQNRLEVAQRFTDRFDSWEKVNAYHGLEAAATARSLLRQVNAAASAVEKAISEIGEVFRSFSSDATLRRANAGDLGPPEGVGDLPNQQASELWATAAFSMVHGAELPIDMIADGGGNQFAPEAAAVQLVGHFPGAEGTSL